MEKIKKFSEFVSTDMGSLHELDHQEKVDEGWKEILIAGALALATGKTKAQDRDIAAVKQNIEYSVSKEKKAESVTVDFGTDFLSGRYILSDEKSEGVEVKLKEIADFIKKHQNNDIRITIIAGESQVPNRDVDGGKVNGEYRRLPKGGLAKNRANTMKEVVDVFMKTLVDKGVMKGKYVVNVSDPIIGKTPYKPGEDPGQEKFTKEQFVKIVLEATGETHKETEKFAAYSVLGERIFNSNRHALGDIYVKARETKDIRDAGNTDTGHENLLLRTIDKWGKYDGRKFLIPWQWWNKDRRTTTVVLDDQDWAYVQSHFEVK